MSGDGCSERYLSDCGRDIMKHKCWKCGGLIRIVAENDPSDNRFWHDCKICEGKGYQGT